ncbi:hypothetical protein PLICRDRAFT_52227 [Plicaturopsis crispa FD-325 SS-3]|nr:hypothetical protein PLICRDRAFT_52227 [Plicaturopsis crispa FD-325 SS-3]
MMDRLWKDPENSLKPGEQHVEERRLLTLVLGCVITREPSFNSTIDDEWDCTVQVLTRYWIHSVDVAKHSDSLMTCGALLEILCPQKPPIRAYRSRHPPPPSLFSRVVEGACGDVKKIVSVAESQLGRTDPRETLLLLQFVEALALMAMNPKTRPSEHCAEFLCAYRMSHAFWSALFILLRKAAAIDKMTGGHGGFHNLADKIADMVVATFNGTLSESVEIQEALIHVWIRANIFQAVEEVAPRFAYVPGINACLCTIFSGIPPLLVKSPELLVAILSEFPRPRLTRALRDPPPPLTDPSRVYIADCTDHPRSAGALLRALEQACNVRCKCARRDCGKHSDKRCSKCRSVGYCSAECQKQDWKAHKLVCTVLAA